MNPSYALIGSGRLARHLGFYLSQTQSTCIKWSRNSHPDFNTYHDIDNLTRLQNSLQKADFVLLAISDDALEHMVEQLQPLLKPHQQLVHFSAACDVTNAVGLHPMMSFNSVLLPADQYAGIPFCEPKEHPGSFQQVFPKWKNPVFQLDSDQRKYYHACLVTAGNFTALLWKEVEQRFETKLNLNPALLKPYQQKIFENIRKNSSLAVTGPLVRGDQKTISANLKALEEDSLQKIYSTFADVFSKISKEIL